MMAVSRCRITGNEYYRVYRKIGDRTHQRYFSVAKLGEDRARTQADAEDAALAERQRCYFQRLLYDTNYLIHADGRIRGVTRTIDKRGKPILRVQLYVPWYSTIQTFWASISEHGERGAFARVIDFLVDRLGLDPRGRLTERLCASFAVYFPNQALAPSTELDDEDVRDFTRSLKTAIQHYNKEHSA